MMHGTMSLKCHNKAAVLKAILNTLKLLSILHLFM